MQSSLSAATVLRLMRVDPERRVKLLPDSAAENGVFLLPGFGRETVRLIAFDSDDEVRLLLEMCKRDYTPQVADHMHRWVARRYPVKSRLSILT